MNHPFRSNNVTSLRRRSWALAVLMLSAAAGASAALPLSSLSPAAGPTKGGIVLTINGGPFIGGMLPVTYTVRVGANNCPVINVFSSSITCTLPAGEGENLPVVVTSSAGSVSNALTFRYNAPLVNAVMPAAGPTAGGTLIAVSGQDFGFSATVTVGNQPCLKVNQNHSEIKCTLPPGQGTNQHIRVNVGGQIGYRPIFNYLPPSITAMNPGSAPLSGGVELTLEGANFGTAAMVTVGGQPCPTSMQTHTQIRCALPAGSGTNLPVVATVAGQQSAMRPFSYIGPLVASISPSRGQTAGGTELQIAGSGFGATPSVTVGGRPCLLSGPAVDTAIRCIIPAGQGIGQTIVVTAAGSTAQGPTFAYDPPAIASVSPWPLPTAGGIEATLRGQNFGTAAAVSIGGAPCNLTSQTHSEIRCNLPASDGQARAIVVTAAGQSSPSFAAQYLPPAITAINPIAGAGGAELTISGMNFGGQSTVTVGGSPCANRLQTQTEIRCTLPAGGGSQPVVVSRYGQQSGPLPFTYSLAVTSVSPSFGPTAGGAAMTISGSGLGATSVTIGGQPCPVAQQSETQIVCTLPAGQGMNQPVVVTSNGMSAAPVIFNYSAPLVSGTSPSMLPTAGGIELTINGANFGTSASVSLGGLPCPVSAQTHTQIRCMAPASDGMPRPVQVVAGGQSSPMGPNVGYAAPAVMAINPLTVPASGGVELTIAGANFGTAAAVQIGGVNCAVLGQTHTQIRCTVPAGAGQQPLIVTRTAQQSAPIAIQYQ